MPIGERLAPNFWLSLPGLCRLRIRHLGVFLYKTRFFDSSPIFLPLFLFNNSNHFIRTLHIINVDYTQFALIFTYFSLTGLGLGSLLERVPNGPWTAYQEGGKFCPSIGHSRTEKLSDSRLFTASDQELYPSTLRGAPSHTPIVLRARRGRCQILNHHAAYSRQNCVWRSQWSLCCYSNIVVVVVVVVVVVHCRRRF